MIHHVDKALRALLMREMAIETGAVEINFDQPTRDWSSRTNSRPTINIFLHDVRENTKLRNIQWEQKDRNGQGRQNTVTSQRTPVRFDLHYLITAWAKEAVDEHRLLSQILMALFRYAHLPPELLPDKLQESQPLPIPLKVAQYDELRNPADVWSALENDLRTGIVCIVTLALNPFLPIETKWVTTRELRVGQASDPRRERLDSDIEREAAEAVTSGKEKPAPANVGREFKEPDLFWTIGGTIKSREPLEELTLTLVERGLEVPLQDEGRFMIGNLQAGDYTLEILRRGGQPSRHPVTVPSPDYKIEV